MSNPSKWIGFVIGAIEIVVGLTVPGMQFLVVSGVTMIVSQAVVDLTAPKAPARQASEMTIQLGEQPRSAIFGRCFTAGSLVDAFDFGGKYGTDWECLIIRLADHACEGLVQFKVNDKFYDYTANGDIAAFDGQHYNHLHIYFRADTNSDTFPSEVTDNWPGYASGDQGRSGCDIAVLYRCDTPNSSHPLYPGGRPTFGFVVDGKKCYDPRSDTSVGGSGTHRWDDPLTWEWSENPAVCLYNYRRGIYANDRVIDPSGLLVGRGLSEAEAPPENVFAPANLCDEDVGSGVRYRIGGPVYSNQTFYEVEEMFALATGGSTVTRQGSVELEPGAAKSIVATFTDDDILSGSSVTWNGGVLSESSDEWVNTVVANYVEPKQQWNGHDAPVVRDVDDILADGKPRESQLTLRLVHDAEQAQRVADIGRRLGRLWGRATVTLGPRFCRLEDGDWVQWTSTRRFGGATRTFRVESYTINEKWQNTLQLREINASCFADAAYDPDYSTPAEPTEPPPDVGAPGGSQWALAAVTLADSQASVPALEITGSASDDESAEAIVFEYWKSDGVIDPVANPDDPTWSMEGTHSRDTTKVDIVSVQGGATYYAAVTYIVSGSPGDRLVLGPVTVASLDVSGQIPPPIQDELDALSSTWGSILFRGTSSWQALAPGTDGYVLTTHDSGADPTWEDAGVLIGSGAAFSNVGTIDMGTGVSSLAPTYPTSVVVDDIAILTVLVTDSVSSGSQTVTVPAGWTLIQNIPQTTIPSLVTSYGAQYWKRLAGTESGTVAVTLSETNNTGSAFAAISTWQGCVTSGTPVEAAAFKAEGATTTQVSSLIATTGAHRRIVAHFLSASTNVTATVIGPATQAYQQTRTGTGVLGNFGGYVLDAPTAGAYQISRSMSSSTGDLSATFALISA